MLKAIFVAILVGMSLSLLLSILIKLTRGKNTVRSSLIDAHHLIGSQAIVTVPFDYKTQGKVRVNTQESLIEWIAVTDSPYSFQKGDFVTIIGIKQLQLWVIPDDSVNL